MTRFKKCDDCGCILNGKTKNKVKTSGGMGVGKQRMNNENGGGYWQETPIVIFLCDDCYKFHESENNNGEEVREGSALDKILAKRSSPKNAGVWAKHAEVKAKWDKIKQEMDKHSDTIL